MSIMNVMVYFMLVASLLSLSRANLFSPTITGVFSNSTCQPNATDCTIDGNKITCKSECLNSLPSNVIDGNVSTSWESSNVDGLPQGAAELYIQLKQTYIISEISVIFTRPPLMWTVEYFMYNDNSYRMVAVLVNDTIRCPNSNITCVEFDPTSAVIAVDVNMILTDSGQTFEDVAIASNIKLTFIEPTPSIDEFYGVAEIYLKAACYNSLADCRDRHFSYSESLPIMPNRTTLLWKQFDSWPMLDAWYLKNLTISSDDGITPLFINESDVDGGKFQRIADCDPLSSQEVLFFNEGRTRMVAVSLPPRSRHDSVMYSLGFIVPNYECTEVIVSPKVELHMCSNVMEEEKCSLVKLYTLGTDCGDCVNDHLLKLREIQILINSSQLLIILNRTEYDNWHRQISITEEFLLIELSSLNKSETFYGVHYGYPSCLTNISCTSELDSYEVTENKSILYRLYFVHELLKNTSLIYSLNETSNAVYDTSLEVSEEVSVVNDRAVSSLHQLTGYLNNLTSIINELFVQLNEALSADVIRRDSLFILNRQYDHLKVRLDQLIIRTSQANDAVSAHNELVLLHSVAARNTSDSITEHKRLIPLILETADTLIDRSDGIANDHGNISTILTDIERLFVLVDKLEVLITSNINDTNRTITSIEVTLNKIDTLYQELSSLLLRLSGLIRQFNVDLDLYESNLDNFTPPNYPDPCTAHNHTHSCTPAESHALSLTLNSTMIINGSLATIDHAHHFINNLPHLPDINLTAIRETAIGAITTSTHVIEALADTDTNTLKDTSEYVYSNVTAVYHSVNALLNQSVDILRDGRGLYNITSDIQGGYSSVVMELGYVNVLVEQIQLRPNYTSEAIALGLDAMVSMDELNGVNRSLTEINKDIDRLNINITTLRSAVNDTRRLVNVTTTEVHQLDEVLSITDGVIADVRSGLDTILQENNDIMSEIDSLLGRVSDTHSLIGKVNSPVRLAANGDINPYVSLQPPPGQGPNITIATVDMYLYPDAGYTPPALLFYAGPIIDASSNDTRPIENEDFMSLTTELSPRRVTLRWRIGGRSNSLSQDFDITSDTEVYVTQSGSMFQLKVINPGIPEPVRNTDITGADGDIIFRATDRTVYLVGGFPPNTRTALPAGYRSHSGLVHLLLVNGELWSLWNYRNRSMTTFTGEFRTVKGVTDNAWTTSSRSTSNPLSFDGDGYVHPIQLLPSGTFAPLSTLRFFIYVKGIEDGLIAFMYDPQTSVSLEMAMYEGNIHIIIGGPTFDDVVYTRSITAADLSGSSNELLYAFNRGQYIIRYRHSGINNDLSRSQFQFFTDLTQLEVWFGGVRVDQLPVDVRPSLTTRGFKGCLDMEVVISNVITPVFDSGFEEFYIRSDEKTRLSGTCLRNTPTTIASFNSSGYLTFNEVQSVPKINDPTTNIDLDNKLVISLSYYPTPTTPNIAALMYIRDTQNKDILILLDGGFPVVMTQRQLLLLQDIPSLATNQWHHILVEVHRPVSPSTHSVTTLYVDGKQVWTTRGNNGLTQDLFINDIGNINAVHIGGTSSRAIGGFAGCIKDVAINYEYISLVSSALDGFRVPAGVSFDTCTHSNASNQDTPLVDIFAGRPQDSSCLSSPPVSLSRTIGSFHSLTSVASYNTLPFENSSWDLSFSMRRVSGDGHVISISSHPSIEVTLSLSSNRPTWSLYQDGRLLQSVTTISPSPSNTWINMSLSGMISDDQLILTPSVNQMSLTSLSVSYPLPSYEPQLPLVIGYKDNKTLSFVGCIRDLMINGDGAGFIQEGITTCLTCYSEPTSGWGFIGNSYIRKSIRWPSAGENVRLSFSLRASKEYGLIMMMRSGREPLIGVGLYRGELRVSNFSQINSYISLSTISLCDPSRLTFHNITAIISDGAISLALNRHPSMTVSVSTTSIIDGAVTLYIGGIDNDDAGLIISRESRLFSFLVQEQFGFPPNFIGCLQAIQLQDTNDNQLAIDPTADTSNVMVGLCPAS